MTGPTWRRAARFFFEAAYTVPFVNQAHRVERPEPLWHALIVYAAGILIGLAALWVFGGPGS